MRDRGYRILDITIRSYIYLLASYETTGSTFLIIHVMTIKAVPVPVPCSVFSLSDSIKVGYRL
jgi:hypothetical protein